MSETLPVTHFVEIKPVETSSDPHQLTLKPYYSHEPTIPYHTFPTLDQAEYEAIRLQIVDPTIRGNFLSEG